MDWKVNEYNLCQWEQSAGSLSTCLGEVKAVILLIWILSMASDLQKDLRTGQGHYQDMSWDILRLGRST